MRILKLCDFQQFLQCDFSRFRIAVNELGKILVPLVRQIAQFLVLCVPIFCEASPFPEWKHANKEFNLYPVGHIRSCVRVFDFADDPIAYSGTSFVEILAPVSPQVEPESSPKAQQEADGVKGDDVGSYGLGDLVKDHGLGFLIFFMVGFLCVAGGYSRRY